VVLVCVVAVASYVVREREFLFFMSPRDLCRLAYGSNPFAAAPEVGRYLRERTAAEDRIAVLGSEPEIYFYADRKSATGHIYVYGMTEIQPYARRMQEEMIQEVEAAHPTFLVFVQNTESWAAWPDSDRTVLEWAERYVHKCYDVVGIADMGSTKEIAYVWEGDAVQYRPTSENLLYTFRRKSDAACSAR
jgi:hypothetical protein